MEQQEPLTAAEVADVFRVNAASVKRWVKQGRLTGFRTPTGRLRFDRAAIEAWLRGESR